MHDLKAIFDKILLITNQALGDRLNTDGNLKSYLRKSKLADNEIIALSICQECLSIDSENWFLAKLKSDYPAAFPSWLFVKHPHLNAILLQQDFAKKNALWSAAEEEDFFLANPWGLDLTAKGLFRNFLAKKLGEFLTAFYQKFDMVKQLFILIGGRSVGGGTEPTLLLMQGKRVREV